MSAVSDAYTIIATDDNPMGFNPDYVFKYYLTDEMIDETKKNESPVLILITDIQSVAENYASNVSHAVSGRIQVQAWYLFDDATDYETLLRKYMEKYGFYLYDYFVAKDPDVKRLYLTAKFSRNKLD